MSEKDSKSSRNGISFPSIIAASVHRNYCNFTSTALGPKVRLVVDKLPSHGSAFCLIICWTAGTAAFREDKALQYT